MYDKILDQSHDNESMKPEADTWKYLPMELVACVSSLQTIF